MNRYLYPQNLKARANLWLWNLRDFMILGISAMLSVVCMVELQLMLPAALTFSFGFLTIQFDEATVLDYIKYAGRFLICDQQYYEWGHKN